MTPKKPEGGMWNSRTTHLHIEQTSPVDLWITSTLSAYRIRSKSFEVSTSVWKIASFSIKIISADAGNRESPAAAQRHSRAGARDIDIFGDPLLVAVSCSVRTGCLWITP